MDNKLIKSILGGFIATLVMTMVIFSAPMMGIPEMSPPKMLAGMLELPIRVGWIMHFIVGIVFAFAYTYLLAIKLTIDNVYLRGLVFGVIAFVLAQVMMMLMAAMIQMPPIEGSMVLAIIGGLVGHIVFGVVIAAIIGDSYK